MNKKINKLYIFGPPGAGKSTFTKNISKELSIPRYDTDDLRFIKKFSQIRSRENRNKKLKTILNKKKWIIDAKASNWEIDSMKRADIIIWFQTSFLKRAFMILKRYFKNKLKKEFEESFSDVLWLIKVSYGYEHKENFIGLKNHKKFIRENKINPFIVKNKKDLINVKNKIKANN